MAELNMPSESYYTLQCFEDSSPTISRDVSIFLLQQGESLIKHRYSLALFLSEKKENKTLIKKQDLIKTLSFFYYAFIFLPDPVVLGFSPELKQQDFV